MDGKNRKVIARSNLKWPNGLTLDYPNRFVLPVHLLLFLYILLHGTLSRSFIKKRSRRYLFLLGDFSCNLVCRASFLSMYTVLY